MKMLLSQKTLAALGMGSSGSFLPWSMERAPVCLLFLIVGFFTILYTAEWLQSRP